MKPLMIAIAVAALAAGSLAWAGTQGTHDAWSRYDQPAAYQMQMVGQTPTAGQMMRPARTGNAYRYGRQQCSGWFGWMGARHHGAR